MSHDKIPRSCDKNTSHDKIMGHMTRQQVTWQDSGVTWWNNSPQDKTASHMIRKVTRHVIWQDNLSHDKIHKSHDKTRSDDKTTGHTTRQKVTWQDSQVTRQQNTWQDRVQWQDIRSHDKTMITWQDNRSHDKIGMSWCFIKILFQSVYSIKKELWKKWIHHGEIVGKVLRCWLSLTNRFGPFWLRVKRFFPFHECKWFVVGDNDNMGHDWATSTL